MFFQAHEFDKAVLIYFADPDLPPVIVSMIREKLTKALEKPVVVVIGKQILDYSKIAEEAEKVSIYELDEL